MTSAAPGLLMALAASVALSTSYLLQHAGSASAAAVSARRPWTTLRSLLRSPRWSVGAAVGMAGWALHVGALSRAPLSLVQAFVAGGLALTVPLAVVLAGHRAGRAERRATLAMVAALVLLSAGAHATGTAGAPPAALQGAYLLGLALLAGPALVLAPGARRAQALARDRRPRLRRGRPGHQGPDRDRPQRGDRRRAGVTVARRRRDAQRRGVLLLPARPAGRAPPSRSSRS